MTELIPRLAALAAREQLLTILQQTADLRGRGVFTLPEHEQLQAILHAALRRLEAGPLQPAQDAGEILDAVEVDADPNAPDVLDAVELLSKSGVEVLDAVAIEGDVDGAEVLDGLDLPGDDILDALDLGNVDDSDALDAELLDGLAEERDAGIMDELPLPVSGEATELDFGSDVGGEDSGGIHFDFGSDVAK